MTLSKFRGVLYRTARALGDVQAVTHKNPGKAIPQGVLAAVVVGFVVYMTLPVLLALTKELCGQSPLHRDQLRQGGAEASFGRHGEEQAGQTGLTLYMTQKAFGQRP